MLCHLQWLIYQAELSFSITFKDRQLSSMTFQAWKMKFLISMSFQVFHDLYEPFPCSAPPSPTPSPPLCARIWVRVMIGDVFNSNIPEKQAKKFHTDDLSLPRFGKYSRIPITRTFKGNRKQFELSGVRVIEGKIIQKTIWREMKIVSS